MQTKQSFHSQTLSSKYRSQQTAKSFDRESNRFTLPSSMMMPDLKNVHNEKIDLSLAQIVQLGKTRQRELVGKGPEAKLRAKSFGSNNYRRRIDVSEVEDEEVTI